MSAININATHLSDELKLSISFKWLLALYAIIPLCLALQLIDESFWQGYLQSHLPSSPNHFIVFQILFGTPHIIASTLLLTSNSDYLKNYSRKLMLMTLAIAIVFGLGSLFIPYKVFYVLVAAWTVYHVIKQQHGVARSVCRLPNWAFYVLLWLSVIAGLIIYVGIFLKNSLDVQQTFWIKQSAGLLCISLILFGIYCQRYVSSLFGRCFLWANIFLVLSSFYLYLQQYYFLAILVPRLVHDATAYTFYVTHDYNRHHSKPHNFMYRIARLFHIPLLIVLPLCSFALAFALQAYGDDFISRLSDFFFGVSIHKVITLGLLGYLALMHYYTEAFTWKNDSPYRRYIAFSK
jgi:hypothetical protein